MRDKRFIMGGYSSTHIPRKNTRVLPPSPIWPRCTACLGPAGWRRCARSELSAPAGSRSFCAEAHDYSKGIWKKSSSSSSLSFIIIIFCWSSTLLIRQEISRKLLVRLSARKDCNKFYCNSHRSVFNEADFSIPFCQTKELTVLKLT